MSRPSDDEMDYLLSRGRLGGSQRRRILDTALAASRPRPWARWRALLAWGGGGVALAAGAAVLLLALRPKGDDGGGGFQVKGGNAPLITLTCLGASVAACPPGSKLAFSLDGGRDRGGFLSAYADPVESGQRVWYLHGESVGAANADFAPRVVPRGALVGPGQPVGRYRVHAVFSRRPVSREALGSLAPADVLARMDLDLVVSP
ncbi:MAG: hypothetical protein JF614_33205 [Acidobacteria bacterium]|nr:hypothetical protein [Acidobacteriota bacterium]